MGEDPPGDHVDRVRLGAAGRVFRVVGGVPVVARGVVAARSAARAFAIAALARASVAVPAAAISRANDDALIHPGNGQ
jgi:hypothetical protein